MPKTDLREIRPPQIRPIERADVPALLEIIADSRREYGIGDKGAPLLEPGDHTLYDNYQRQRTLYFVAVLGGRWWAALAWHHSRDQTH